MFMNDQTIRGGQALQEQWTIEYSRLRDDSPIVGRLVSWPHYTYYATRGEASTVDGARLALVDMMAKAIHADPNPFGDLGNVAHIGQVIKFLDALHQDGSEYYLPEQLKADIQLPDGWEDVIGHVIDMVKSWADYYPEEETGATEELIDKIDADEQRED
jgi:hypothetical protein